MAVATLSFSLITIAFNFPAISNLPHLKSKSEFQRLKYTQKYIKYYFLQPLFPFFDHGLSPLGFGPFFPPRPSTRAG
jgi:hypothetical protein